jgi:hypothetical protein
MVETHPQLRDQSPSIAQVSDIGLFLFTRISTICHAPMWRGQWWVPWRVRSSRRVSYDPQSQTFQQLPVCIGKGRGELLHKLLAFSACPSTLCFFAFMVVAHVLLLITDHSAVLFFVSLKLASL